MSDAEVSILLERFWTVGLGVLGLLVGSFLNVVIARVPHGQSIVTPRSRCPGCGHQLAWYENIPVFSWLALRGRCRGCKAPISARYLVVELLTALLYLGCVQRFGFTYHLLPALVFVSLLIPLTFIDLEHWLLPFALTLPGIAAGLLLSLGQGLPSVLDAVIGAVAGFGVFWGMELVGYRIFKKEALGGGDKYLLAMIGAFLSWRALLPVVFLSSLQGALVGSILLLISGRAGPAAPPREGGTSPGDARPLDAAPPAPAPAADAPPDNAELAMGAATAAGEEDVPLLQGPAAEPTASGPAGPDEDDWEPGPTNIPFGPWLSLAALQVMLLGPLLARLLPSTLSWLMGAAPRP